MADNTLRIGIFADTKGLNAGLIKAQTRLKAFGTKMSAVGASLQTKLALPLLAGAAASIKMAADFDKSMTKIKTLVGVAGDEVDGMSLNVKSMAQNAGVNAAEAADALFFITSAGLRGADALDVLDASTKAAALGLGDTATVADLATSAMNAYGKDTLGAMEATDVLTSAVREGKLEASELAGAMGQVLPVASNMGVSFHEVGAAFAAMSRTGTNANVAATQLKGILNGILKPSEQAKDMLFALGLSTESLRKNIKEEGLLSTLEILKTKFEGNADAQQTVFGNVRALTGVMDLLGASVDNTRIIFDNMGSVTGMTNKAFVELQKSSEFKLRKGLIQLKNSFADVGAVLMETLLPLISNFLGFIKDLFVSFQNLDPVTQQIAIGFGLLAAALPTILSLGGALLGIFAAMISPIGLIAAGVAAVAFIIHKNWNEVLPVLVDFVNIFISLFNRFEPIRQALFGLKSVFQMVFIAARARVDRFINVFKTMWKIIKEFGEKKFSGSFTDIIKDGFKEGELITKKAAIEIGETFAENYEKALNSRMEKITVKGAQKALTKLSDLTKNSIAGMFSSGGVVAPKVKAAPVDKADGALKGLIAVESQAKKTSTAIQDLNLHQQKMADLGNFLGGELSSAFSQIGNSIVESMGFGEDAMGRFASAFMKSAFDAVGAALSVAVSAAIAGAAQGSLLAGPGAAILLPALIAGMVGLVKGSFSKDVPKFANGGIVSSPTLGLMGEYSGARSNPEVIAPLDKLKGMIGDRSQNVNVGGEFRIQGQDLVVALQRADKNRSRIL